ILGRYNVECYVQRLSFTRKLFGPFGSSGFIGFDHKNIRVQLVVGASNADETSIVGWFHGVSNGRVVGELVVGSYKLRLRFGYKRKKQEEQKRNIGRNFHDGLFIATSYEN